MSNHYYTVEIRGKHETISLHRPKPVHFALFLSSQEIQLRTSSANVIPPTTTLISSLPVHLRLSFNHHLLQLQIKSFIGHHVHWPQYFKAHVH